MRGWWQRHRTAALVGAGTLLALVVAVLLGTDASTSATHDPDNPGATGARAVARVLADQGVDVRGRPVRRRARGHRRRRGHDRARHLPRPPGTQHRPAAAGARRAGDGRGRRPRSGRGAGPGGRGRRARPASPTPRGPPAAPTPASTSCAGLAVDVDRATAWPTTAGCFGGPDGWWLASADDGLLLLGAAGILENDQVLRADNATAALRLLGRGDRLVWYVPDLADLAGDDGVSLRSLLPPWLLPAVWLGGIALVAVAWWRGRRLGPLAVEPLPVTVRALETTHARGRLYRDAADRAHAARALRRHSRTAAATHLRLPARDTATVARDVARALGRPTDEVAALLDDTAPAPRTDDELIRLATSLAALDREVRAT